MTYSDMAEALPFWGARAQSARSSREELRDIMYIVIRMHHAMLEPVAEHTLSIPNPLNSYCRHVRRPES